MIIIIIIIIIIKIMLEKYMWESLTNVTIRLKVIQKKGSVGNSWTVAEGFVPLGTQERTALGTCCCLFPRVIDQAKYTL